ncbi:MAG: TerC family protein [Burkholderiaceae bacterium]|nr:TerC family protein [Roseateles sp.]MBV8471477.1 TerC family protein [Burkholderiaceae bacterium]
MSVDFWVAFGQIILIDILLGGDNAVLIAMACRRLPEQQRRMGIVWGTVGAIALRVVLIFFALTLLQVPYLKLAGAVLLLWIGAKLMLSEQEHGHGEVQASERLWSAVKTIIVADFVMSLDNVVAIAGAAEAAGGGSEMLLVVLGLLISIPLVAWGSQGVLKLMDRFPAVVTVGALLLGWIAGTMAVGDAALEGWVEHFDSAMPGYPAAAAGLAGAVAVWLAGRWLTRRQALA